MLWSNGGSFFLQLEEKTTRGPTMTWKESTIYNTNNERQSKDWQSFKSTGAARQGVTWHPGAVRQGAAIL